jgi:hypothetical protein
MFNKINLSNEMPIAQKYNEASLGVLIIEFSIHYILIAFRWSALR